MSMPYGYESKGRRWMFYAPLSAANLIVGANKAMVYYSKEASMKIGEVLMGTDVPRTGNELDLALSVFSLSMGAMAGIGSIVYYKKWKARR